MRGKDGPRVGVFDSGLGGLNVLGDCLKLAGGITYFYYGDNCHAPYGSKKKEEIERLVEQGLKALARKRIDAAVLACNTASAVCLEKMREKFPFPIIGMEPAVSPAAHHFRRVLVLCTPRTAESERLKRLLARHPASKIDVFAPKDLAKAIEDHLLKKAPLDLSKHLPKGSWDAVVLGCTHYSFFRDEIAAFYGAKVFDGGEGTAAHLIFLLKVGTDDHQKPLVTLRTQMVEKCEKQTKNRIVFIGPCRKMNKCIFLSNICSKVH